MATERTIERWQGRGKMQEGMGLFMLFTGKRALVWQTLLGKGKHRHLDSCI